MSKSLDPSIVVAPRITLHAGMDAATGAKRRRWLLQLRQSKRVGQSNWRALRGPGRVSRCNHFVGDRTDQPQN